jgi:hypothetical protein
MCNSASLTTNRFGETNSAIYFNGLTDYIEVPYSSALNPASFTVAAWVYPTGGSGNYGSVIASRDDYPQRGYILYKGYDETWQFWVGGETSWYYGGKGNANVQFNAWTFLVQTFDGSTGQFYQNGALQSSLSVPYVVNTARPLRIGTGATESATPSNYFMGAIDEVRIYDRALSQYEVTFLYNYHEPSTTT